MNIEGADLSTPGGRLRHARKRNFRSAEKAAEAYGWNPNTLRSHENGSRGIRRDEAARYARALGVSTSWLLLGQGSPDGPGAPDELALIAKYRKVPEQIREMVHTILDQSIRRTSPEQEPGRLQKPRAG